MSVSNMSSSTRVGFQIISKLLSRCPTNSRMCQLSMKVDYSCVGRTINYSAIQTQKICLRSLSSLPGDALEKSKLSEDSTNNLDKNNNDVIIHEVMPALTKIIVEKSKFRTPNLKYVEGLAKILASFKLKPSEIIDCLAENHQELNKLGHETLTDKVGYLRANGFHPAEVASLLKNSPQVLTMKKEAIKESLQSYMGVGVPDGRLQILLSREPALFRLSEKQVHRRMKNFGNYFTRKEIIEIASNYPNIFLDSWENIERKFKYVIYEMGLEIKHLRRFEVFQHSLLHMKIRHKLLYKAGLYQTPDKQGTTEIENPGIARIMDTSDKVFAYQVASLTLNELEAFAKMEELENLLESLEEESESDDDDDDDVVNDDDVLQNLSEENKTTLKRLAKYKRDKMN